MPQAHRSLSSSAHVCTRKQRSGGGGFASVSPRQYRQGLASLGYSGFEQLPRAPAQAVGQAQQQRRQDGDGRQQQQQRAEASYEELVARLCDLGCRLHHQALPQAGQCLAGNAAAGGAAGSGSGGAGSSAGGAARGSSLAAAAASSRGSKQAAMNAGNARRGAGSSGGGSAGRGSSTQAAAATSSASGSAGRGSRNKGTAARAAGSAAAAAAAVGLPPRAAELAAAADDLAAIGKMVAGDPSDSTPDIFTAAHQRGQLHGLVALLGWCLRLAVPSGPPFTPAGSCLGGAGGTGSTSGGGTADMVRLLQLLVRGGCFELTQAALARCCYALEPALPPAPPAAELAASPKQRQQPQRRARLGSSGWSLLWLWLSFTHDMIACAEWCVGAANTSLCLLRQFLELRDSLPDPALALKLLDCYSRTLLCAAAAVAGGSGGGAPPAPQQADALARAMRFYGSGMPNQTLRDLSSPELQPHLAACPALSYALAAHAVHTCAAADGGGTYGLRCGPVAAAMAAAVAPGEALRRGGVTSSRSGEVPAAGADSGGEEAGGAVGGVVLPLLGPGNKVLQPPEQLLQRRRRAGGGDCSGSGGSSGRGSSTAGPAVVAAAAALPVQAAVALDVTLAERAAEAWQAALARGWSHLLFYRHILDSNHLAPREQLRLCRTQPGCLRAAYARASWLAEGMQQSAEAAAAEPQQQPSKQLVTKPELDRWLAAARSCPLLHCGGAFEQPDSGSSDMSSSGGGGEGSSSTQIATRAGEDQQQTARQPQPRRRLELVGVSLAVLATTGVKLARQAWQDTSALWLPKTDAIALGGSSSSSSSSSCGGNGSSSNSSSSSSSGGNGGVPYPPLSVQRDLLSWWRVVLGWAALSDLDRGDNGSASESAAAYSIRTAWYSCLRLLDLDLCATGMRHVESDGDAAAAGWTYLPPLRLRPSPDVAAALAAGYLPVYGRVMRRAADRKNLRLVATRSYDESLFGGAAAAWAQLLVFGQLQQAQAFVADVAELARRRIEMLRAAVATAAAAGQQQKQGEKQTERQPQHKSPVAAGASAPTAPAAAAACAAAVPPLSVSAALELAWESLSLCRHAIDCCSAGGITMSLLSSSLLVAAAAPGSSSSGSSGSSTSAQAASPLAGLQLGDEAAVAARTVAAARAVASQLLPVMSDTMRAVALAVGDGRHSTGAAAAPLLSHCEAMGFANSAVAMLRWVPLLVRAAALAPDGEVSNGAARARPDDADGDARDQQQQRDGAERDLLSSAQCVWRRRDYWERLLWRGIDLPALLRSLCGMMRAAADEGHNTAAAAPAAAVAPAAGAGGKTGVSQPAAAGSSSGAGRSQAARTLDDAILPELVAVMTSVLQLAPLRLLHVPGAPQPSQPSQPQPVAAAAAATGQQRRLGRIAEAAPGSFATAASAAAPAAAAVAEGAAGADAVSTGGEPNCSTDASCGAADGPVDLVHAVPPAAATAPAVMPLAPLVVVGGEATVAAPAPALTSQSTSSGADTGNSGGSSSGCSSRGSSSSIATASTPAAPAAAPAAPAVAAAGAAAGYSRIDVPRVCEHMRAWGCCGDGPPLATHLAGVLEGAAAGDWEAVRAGSRWLRFGAAVTHAPGDVAARLWRQQRQVLEHGVGYGVPLEASVMDGALDAAASLLLGLPLRAA
ncbi:hypothetical protein HXX76_012859 [Chlamydomonas incerta]|uniref:Uncharacterized protein n=1 Tax=Chlamydomonas incerta TaxID=51695 RepID=A0A835VT30_CHLIN|nr:hypothetical protein HXX76_012859 [Chlamydomonas incerta]|eukprot:KAG2426805.1 hypothetical protein HXX76_012859 [Chlamydomonas incerta]